MRWYMDLDAPARKLTLGMSETEVEGHVFYVRKPGASYPKGKVQFGFLALALRERAQNPFRPVLSLPLGTLRARALRRRSSLERRSHALRRAHLPMGVRRVARRRLAGVRARRQESRSAGLHRQRDPESELSRRGQREGVPLHLEPGLVQLASLGLGPLPLGARPRKRGSSRESADDEGARAPRPDDRRNLPRSHRDRDGDGERTQPIARVGNRVLGELRPEPREPRGGSPERRPAHRARTTSST